MAKQKSKTDLLFESIEEARRDKGIKDLTDHAENRSRLEFDNLNVDSIRPKRKQVEYASVKIKTEIFEKVKAVAETQGIRQPGKYITLILEAFLEQVDKR